MNSVKELIINLTAFYKMNWWGFPIGHYMTWIVLAGISIVTLEAYLKNHKNKNDIRRFLISEQHRK